MRHKFLYILLTMTTLLACSCNDAGTDDAMDIASRSVYYWRTVFTLDSAETAFLKENEVKRMYVRYFDVVMNNGDAKPNATIKYAQDVPQGMEIVPTVFIMEDCLGSISVHAEQLVARILQINETHDIAGVKEVQIDCDWTARSQDKYYALLETLRTLLAEKGISLSATIRLHQFQ